MGKRHKTSKSDGILGFEFGNLRRRNRGGGLGGISTFLEIAFVTLKIMLLEKIFFVKKSPPPIQFPSYGSAGNYGPSGVRI